MRRRWVCWIAAVAGLCTAGPVQAAETWALLVGISQYQSPQIASLRFPAADAAGIRAALLDPQLGGLPADHVRLLVDEQATAANVTGAIATFLKPNVRPGDQVLVFLAGHGVAKGVGPGARSFLLPSDVKGLTTAALEASAVDLKALSRQLGQLPASQFVLFVDACREDPTPGRGIKGNPLTDILSRGLQVVPQDPARAASSVTFFACDCGQRAFEDPQLHHGVFTYWILQGIRPGAVPRPPDGTVDMGRLASYVTEKVEEWAKQASADGAFEIEQTPVMVATEVQGPVVLMRVKRSLPGPPVTPEPAKLEIVTVPDGAQVTVNDRAIGPGPVTETLAAGEYTVRAEAAGYQPVERSVKVLDGYQEQVIMRLGPAARGLAGAAGGKAAEFFQRGEEAETRQEWEVAEAGYSAALQADPEFGAAYERLADAYLQQRRQRDAVATLLDMLDHLSPSSHGYTLLSHAYLQFGHWGPGDPVGVKGGWKKHRVAGEFGMPRSEREAGALAVRAAEAAVKSDPNAAEALLALGFALTAADRDGNRKRDALQAFGKAILLDPRNARAHYALGYGIRVFAAAESDQAARRADLERAASALREAFDLRPEYYEAHRELAYCCQLLDDTASARREYSLASAYRGGAGDENEVAGLNLALASLYQEAAEASDGEVRQQYRETAAGYLADARELTPHLQSALDILAAAGVKSHLTHLPVIAGSEDAPEQPAHQEAPGDQPPVSGGREPGAGSREPGAADADVDRFDLSGFPREPTNFEEQQVLEAIHSATNSALKAEAHERLARYYEKRDDAARARAERAKADYWRQRSD